MSNLTSTLRMGMAITAIGCALLLLSSCKKDTVTTGASGSSDCSKVADSLNEVIAAVKRENEALHIHADSLAQVAQHAPTQPAAPAKPRFDGVQPKMIFIKGGTFQMGSNDGDPDEKPTHEETVNNFYLAENEVTVAEYRAFCVGTGRPMSTPPAWGWKDDHPVCYITWEDANAYCKWLSKATSKKYRLPTEVEWEYAARGGANAKNWYYAGTNNPNDAGWYNSNASDETHPIRTKRPNDLGLYDMSGNVWEWCADWYAAYPGGTVSRAPNTYRSCRGGSWNYGTSVMRCADRGGADPSFKYDYLGFRLARD